eukprot:s152_g8.t1
MGQMCGSQEFTCHCLQLLLAVLPRQGTQGQRLVSADMDIRNAMEWFEHVSRTKDLRPSGRFSWAAEDTPAMAAMRRESLQESLAAGQRCLWMMPGTCIAFVMQRAQCQGVLLPFASELHREASASRQGMAEPGMSTRAGALISESTESEAKASAKPTTLQGALAALMTAQLGPIVLEHRLRIPVYDPTSSVPRPSQEIDPPGFMAERRSPGFSEESGRILGDLDSTTGSNDDASVDSSSQASGTVRRILQPSEGGQSSVGSKSSGGAQRVLADLDGDSDASSVVSGIEGEGGPNRRILAASDTSDGGSSESASSAGQGSFALPSSMWSGITYSAASSASTDLLTHRRPLLEGYAHALRPLFMTRGDVTHLLSKFPQQVLLGGVNTARNFAAHRDPEPYMLGSVMTTLLFVGDGVQRTGNEACPVVHEENEEEEWAASECAASAARDDATTQEQSVLEFEEVVVPLTEISSRELFLAELLQSDQLGTWSTSAYAQDFQHCADAADAGLLLLQTPDLKVQAIEVPVRPKAASISSDRLLIKDRSCYHCSRHPAGFGLRAATARPACEEVDELISTVESAFASWRAKWPTAAAALNHLQSQTQMLLHPDVEEEFTVTGEASAIPMPINATDGTVTITVKKKKKGIDPNLQYILAGGLGLLSVRATDLEAFVRSEDPEHQELPESCNLAPDSLPIQAVAAATVGILSLLVGGEILPQALFSVVSLTTLSHFLPLVQVLLWICWPIARPCATDLIFNRGGMNPFEMPRQALLALMRVQQEKGVLSEQEAQILDGAMGLAGKKAGACLTRIEDVHSLPEDAMLDVKLGRLVLPKNMEYLRQQSRSRILVHSADDRRLLVSVIICKSILGVHPKDWTASRTVIGVD